MSNKPKSFVKHPFNLLNILELKQNALVKTCKKFALHRGNNAKHIGSKPRRVLLQCK